MDKELSDVQASGRLLGSLAVQQTFTLMLRKTLMLFLCESDAHELAFREKTPAAPENGGRRADMREKRYRPSIAFAKKK